jgi:hypothetical protein
MAANLGDDATSEASDALDSLARVKGGVTYSRPPWEVLFESSYSVGHLISFLAAG